MNGVDQDRRCLIIGALTSACAPGIQAGEAAAPVGRLDQLEAPWSAVEFSWQKGTISVPGIVLKLPSGQLYAASRQCTHQGCTVNYYRTAAEVRDLFGVEVDGPSLVCPCHSSVFDPNAGGRVVAGPAPTPLARLSVEIEGRNVFVRAPLGST